ncbi:glycosyltransferase family 4 protein [Flavobacterium sp. NKUCC04_CG]|uniref:MraY family glycosyltransferase n=1 Tax=Flavobacterium sp. NKUCC04_CG TaxID=2842121 RepID=UPI001C5ACCE8|nr:glycosyltransferase family 4 protein [Flavobacterium sp. NKUCC04_CG]MBW3517559.1 glycosyltransferase family 4 protein [Flavobacterium sp. NKUCC04_CG]
MHYLVLVILLFVTEWVYFKIADKFNIIDKPNERSSHSEVTLRGGGIVFYFAVMAFFLYSGFEYPWFFLGLTLITLISFLDDVFTLSNKIRLFIHLVSVLLMFQQWGLFDLSVIWILLSLIVVIGTINAYNFMDGINGITALYSLAVLGLLAIVNLQVNFIDPSLIYYSIIGTVVFGFFNIRVKAKCFAGDVGSVSMAFIVLFMLGMLLIKTENFIYILFLAIYGIDTVWTIFRRALKKENIFKAHRSHLYQLLSNEAKKNKLAVSVAYAVIQFIVGYLVIAVSDCSVTTQILFGIGLLFGLSAVYLVLKRSLIKKYNIQ